MQIIRNQFPRYIPSSDVELLGELLCIQASEMNDNVVAFVTVELFAELKLVLTGSSVYVLLISEPQHSASSTLSASWRPFWGAPSLPRSWASPKSSPSCSPSPHWCVVAWSPSNSPRRGRRSCCEGRRSGGGLHHWRRTRPCC